jgi:DNA-binding MarR family transcriptional regulator
MSLNIFHVTKLLSEMKLMELPQESLESLQKLAEQITTHSMRAVFRFAKENDLAYSQLGTLMRMSHGGRRSIMRFGGELSMKGPAMSQMIDRFVAQGLVTRVEDPEDRRAKLIDLSQRGAEMVSGCRKAQVGWIEDLAARLDDEEKRKVIESARILSAKIDKIDAEHAQKCANAKEYHQ